MAYACGPVRAQKADGDGRRDGDETELAALGKG